MFGHRSVAKSMKQAATVSPSPEVKMSNLEAKLKVYNDYYEGKKQQIKRREVNGQLVLEGILLIHWRVQSYIRLAEKDESRASRENWRHSYTMAMWNGLDEDFLRKMDDGGRSPLNRRRSLSGYVPNGYETEERPQLPNRVNLRGNAKRRQRHRRLSIINGHIFDVDTSIFTPAYGSVTSVNVTNLDPVPVVIKQLLKKFKVVNNPEDFCLCVVRSSGETRVLKDGDFPLIERIVLGPLEDVAKLFIMDKGKVKEVNEEVAQYINLPEPVLKGFLKKIQQEEEEEIHKVRLWYQQLKTKLEQRLSEFQSTNL